MTVYQIRDWNLRYENYKSRERDQLNYVSMPNKQSGMGFNRIMAEADGLAIYGAWCAIVGACSQQRRVRNGWLTDTGTPDGSPWSAEDIAFKFRRPVSEISRALEVLSSSRVGWLIAINSDTQKVSDGYPTGAQRVPDGYPTGAVGAGSTPLGKGGKVREVMEESHLSTNAGGEKNAADQKNENASTQKDAASPCFDLFWRVWPTHRRKVDRLKCIKKWNRQKLDDQAEEIIDAVKRWKVSEDWTKDNGQFIPAPLVWLNRRSWEVPAESLEPQKAEPTGYTVTFTPEHVVREMFANLPPE